MPPVANTTNKRGLFILELFTLDPVISVPVNVQRVSGWAVLVTCGAYEASSFKMFRLNVTSHALSYI